MSLLRRSIYYGAALVAAGLVGHAIPHGAGPAARVAGGECAHEPGGLDEARLRAVLRAELANLQRVPALPSSASVVTPAPAPASRPEAEPRPQSARALADGHSVIAEALARRRWSSQDAIELRHLLPQLDPDARTELFAQLFPAINDGRLELATGGAPF